MELWDLLSSNHYSICDYEDSNWDICGENEPDSELWKRNSYNAYTCSVITMGNSLGLCLEYHPTPQQQARLTPSEAVNSRVVTQCFVAFLELHRPEIQNHEYGEPAIPLLEWRNDEEEWENNDVLWALEKEVGWKRLAIENVIETVEL